MFSKSRQNTFRSYTDDGDNVSRHSFSSDGGGGKKAINDYDSDNFDDNRTANTADINKNPIF